MLQHALQAGIDRVNQSAKTLSHEIKDWRIMQQSFTYSSGEVGLTGKMKRRAILERHASCIGAMFVHREMHAFNSKCESNIAPQPHQKHANLSQIKEEDETKTSRQNSPMQQTRRCQSQILLKSKYKLSTRGNNETPKLPNTPENNNAPKVSDDSESKKPDEEHDGSESDNDSGDEDVDPEVKDKERKISEKRILEIVHCDVGIQEKLDGSNANTPNTAPKTKKGEKEDGVSDYKEITDEHSAEHNEQSKITSATKDVARRKISDSFADVSSSTVTAITSQHKPLR
jgi:hypothetical protein